ncbi:MAG TPA: sulfotransferase [Candidatus Limnocylindrales bacterium]|nr:sulfotransferase [Candidatus Limnocylindrales bacterium]
MKRTQLVSQGSIARMLQAANDAIQRRNFREAAEILERASRLDPGNPGILMQSGSACGRHYDYAAAERCFEKAVRLASRKAEALAAAGQLCSDFANYEMAEHYLRRAVEQNGATPEMKVRLAEVYERLRRLPEAAALVERVLQRDNTFGPALFLQAKLDRQANRLEQAESRLRELAAKSEPSLCVRSWYELGGVLDKQKRYDEAMSAFLVAKSLLRPQSAGPIAQLQTVRGRLKTMQAALSAELFQRWFDGGQALAPIRRLALLGGHPRSGTTLLEKVVDSHPDIISAEETPIFHDEACSPLTQGMMENASTLSVAESATADTLRQSRERYFETMGMFLGQPIGNRLLLDKNPSLTFMIPILVRVFPEIKFLIALRDPRDVVLSCFMLPLVPLNQTAAAYLSLESTVEEYTALMGVWRTVAPLMKNAWLEVRYEDMVNDLESVARRALDFLGVSWDPAVLKFDEHARQTVVRSPTYADVTRPVFKTAIARWRNYRKYLEPHLPRLEPFVKAFGYE